MSKVTNKAWYSDQFDRTIYRVWEEQGAPDFDERLRRQTE